MSGTTTVTMNGNSTGYGLSSGNEVFNLYGYDNTVLLDGANDQVNVLDGEYDIINLNSDGFASPVADAIDLGTSGFNTVMESSALTDSVVSITGSGGPNTISMINHDGSTSVTLAYTGGSTYETGLGVNDVVSLNGDAANDVVFTAGGYAAVTIGSAGDGFTNFASSVVLYGLGNSLSGGDEAFTVSDTGGAANTVELGNGNNAVALGGYGNAVTLGNGNNTLAFSSGIYNSAWLGTGSNTIIADSASAKIALASGGTGANDTFWLSGSTVHLAAGDENVTAYGIGYAQLIGHLGNGNNTIDLASGRAALSFGTSLEDTADNTVTVGRGFNYLAFDGGNDQVTLNDALGAKGYDTVVLNGSMLGTKLTAHGVFDQVTLKHDANAIINDTGTNGGLSVTLLGDATGGFGTMSIAGLANDDLAHINLVNASTYYTTIDTTPVGGITLHFDHGSLDLVGLQAIPNSLIS